MGFSRTRTPVPVTSAAALSEQQVFEMIVDEFAKYMQAEAGLGEDDKACKATLMRCKMQLLTAARAVSTLTER